MSVSSFTGTDVQRNTQETLRIRRLDNLTPKDLVLVPKHVPPQ